MIDIEAIAAEYDIDAKYFETCLQVQEGFGELMSGEIRRMFFSYTPIHFAEQLSLGKRQGQIFGDIKTEILEGFKR